MAFVKRRNINSEMVLKNKGDLDTIFFVATVFVEVLHPCTQRLVFGQVKPADGMSKTPKIQIMSEKF